MKRHYSLSEKINLLENITNLEDDALHTLANRLDCCTFAELRRIAEAVKIMAKGK